MGAPSQKLSLASTQQAVVGSVRAHGRQLGAATHANQNGDLLFLIVADLLVGCILSAALLKNASQRGPALIAAGLSILLAAHVWPGVPIVSAIMLVGCGATVTVLARSQRQDVSGSLSLAVYAALGCFASAAQTHAALMGPAGRLGAVQLLDLLLAVALLALLVRIVVRRCGTYSL